MMKKLMKKITVALTVAAMAITATTAVASANDGEYTRTCPKHVFDTEEYEYVVGVSDYLNVRSDASVNAPIIGSLVNGSCVEVTGYIEEAYAGNIINWVQINYNGMEGYVTTDYLGYVNEAEYEVEETSNPDDSYTANEAAQQSEEDTIAYPREDRQISGASGTTWCTKNTDGYYYNEVGARFTNLGNGTFEDTAGNILTMLQ